ncbi:MULTISPECIES: MFS transporter [unclassified Lactobacillus]|uniref:MFS transporter n=1 Tax=unclassified Lactobacillus TaxID=2620435 RepID=UPI000EFA45F0|nr:MULTISPECIES: MFS transporter [unclassified Lactobacillus]RMC24141.1 MFS transporter [Lactobacillus sp. ESL0247]RMC28714.1 MFS transporter [Lactobacillus sp. ESL0246]RMC31371.1 MFS transporter [Lactobacillus sp. ESL0245]
MKSKNLLLISKVLNETGDWFYYFVIVLIVFSVSHDPIYLGLLSASYTLPNLIFSNLISNISSKFNSKKLIIFTEMLRFILLVLMFLATNVVLLLLLVFSEQMLAIASDLNYQNLVVNVVKGKTALKLFNKNTNTWSSVARLLVIPTYTILTKIISNREVLLLDAVLTIVSGILILPISYIRNLQKEHKAPHIEKKKTFTFNKSICLILLVGVLNLVIGFSDSYAISYINLNNNKLGIGYSVFVFLMTLAEFVASILSKKFDDVIEKDFTGKVLSLCSLIIFVFLVAASLFHNVAFFIFSMAASRMIYMWIKLFSLYSYQDRNKDHIMDYVALQNVVMGCFLVFNSSIGSILIKLSNIYIYMIFISLLIFTTTLIFKSLYKRTN